jgi:hypothetical protein
MAAILWSDIWTYLFGYQTIQTIKTKRRLSLFLEWLISGPDIGHSWNKYGCHIRYRNANLSGYRHFPVIGRPVFKLWLYNKYPNTGLVQYSNGPKWSRHWTVWYSATIGNWGKKSSFPMVPAICDATILAFSQRNVIFQNLLNLPKTWDVHSIIASLTSFDIFFASPHTNNVASFSNKNLMKSSWTWRMESCNKFYKYAQSPSDYWTSQVIG